MKRKSLLAIAGWLALTAGLGHARTDRNGIAPAARRAPMVVAMAASAGTPSQPAEGVRIPESLKSARLDELYEKGRQLYEAGDLPGSHAVFEEMLMIDPDEPRARTYLDNTREEWERYQAALAAGQTQREREEKGQQQLKTPITLETKRPMPLNEFVNILSFASGINFNIASNVEASIGNAKFVDVPLHDVLDAVLLPMGLKWSLQAGLVSIIPALETRTFRLNSDQMAKVKALYDDNELQRVLWGADGKPQLQGETLYLDQRDYVLVATDSKMRLEKLNALLSNLESAISPDLITRFYRVQSDTGPKIKALVDTILRVEPPTPFDLERHVYFDGRDMIIRDSPERLVKIEDLLRNQGFLEKLVSDKIAIRAYSLVPREALGENVEYMRAFANNVIEQLQKVLYTKSGMAAAAEQGRKMWFDPNTLTLVLTDYPENIETVSGFLASLPELERKEHFKLIYLKHALSDDMESQLTSLLGLISAAPAEAEKGLTVTKTLRREDEFSWRDLTVIVRRVTPSGDIFDQKSDEAELVLRVRGGQQASVQTVRELDVPVYIQDNAGGQYEIYADDIRPTATVGDGRVRLVITYDPPVALGTTGGTVPGGGGY